MENRKYVPNHSILVGMVLCSLKDYEVKVGERTRKPKNGEPITEDVHERFALPSPFSYDIRRLRTHMRDAAAPILNGQRKRVEISLERWPQVDTVAGEIKANSKRKLNIGFSSNDEEDTMFVIEAA